MELNIAIQETDQFHRMGSRDTGKASLGEDGIRMAEVRDNKKY